MRTRGGGGRNMLQLLLLLVHFTLAFADGSEVCIQENCSCLPTDKSGLVGSSDGNCSTACFTQICACHEGWSRVEGVCTKKVLLNEHCVTETGCQAGQHHSECSSLLSICQCRPGFTPVPDGTGRLSLCSVVEEDSNLNLTGKLDFKLVCILAGLSSMFIVLCIVLQMFSRARFQDNRSIFNTPNPRLMNASFNKTGSDERKRRKSRLRSLQAQEEIQDLQQV